MPLAQETIDALQDDPDTLAAVQALSAEIDALRDATAYDAEAFNLVTKITSALAQTSGEQRAGLIAAVNAAIDEALA